MGMRRSQLMKLRRGANTALGLTGFQVSLSSLLHTNRVRNFTSHRAVRLLCESDAADAVGDLLFCCGG